MFTMKILLIEDEFILADDLSETLQKEGYEVVCVVDNGKDALQFYLNNEVDLILCDININGDWDGIETIKQLMTIRLCPIIYLTALTDKNTLEKAKTTFPAAYIPKPYHITNLRMAIDMAIHNFAFNNQKPTLKIVKNESENLQKEAILQVKDDIFIKQNYQFVKFKLSEVLYLEADAVYTSIITIHKKYAIRQTISHVLERLPLKELVRIHRSYAVNINHIDSFNEQDVIVNGYEIPLSRSYKEEFLKQFMFR
jgi:two-component system, response regulator PdtaR